jgi:hypothetical protein
MPSIRAGLAAPPLRVVRGAANPASWASLAFGAPSTSEEPARPPRAGCDAEQGAPQDDVPRDEAERFARARRGVVALELDAVAVDPRDAFDDQSERGVGHEDDITRLAASGHRASERDDEIAMLERWRHAVPPDARDTKNGHSQRGVHDLDRWRIRTDGSLRLH